MLVTYNEINMALDIFVGDSAVLPQQFQPRVEIVNLEWVLFILNRFAGHDCASTD